jgi:formate dehydrogenase
MAKVLCVLYDDPVDGYPTSYARDRLPVLERYPGGQSLPTPSAVDFIPGELLGSVSGALGLRSYLEGLGHEFVVTSDKDGPDSEFERHLPDAEIVISQPFWPAYLTAERIAKAPDLKLALTAGIGSDHVDLDAAITHGVTVAEVTYCNSISVAEHVVMMILSLVRNYLPSHRWVRDGGWNIADCVARSAPTTSREWMSARSPPAALGSPCCVGWRPSVCDCTTPTATGSRPPSRMNWA